MESWKNPSRPAARSLPPDARWPATGTESGIVQPQRLQRFARVDRLPCAAELAPWIEYYWTVRWDVGDEFPMVSRVVPHPVVTLSLESGSVARFGFEMPAALVHGVITGKFAVDITGSGRAFGIRFRPGGFGAFTRVDVADWTDRVDLMSTAMPGADDLLARVLAVESDADRAKIVDDALRLLVPEPDPQYERLMSIVAGIIADPTLTTVESVVERFGVAERTLQRLFQRYVGVSPKWVLRRYRLHDAMSYIDRGRDDFADLAVELGWSDQSHFTNEFRAVVGMTPGEYQRGI
ncbi:helix-turn-helix domain-containing protein [Smaragdicoccus niigatensis]|uniref:helix-turn-helix domain-containing protein n=1 Tax=Smaragdicoccus niigatensis TaxID=359359 RepID=UPI000A576592|nr:AraC family transcriptional regulator [Smaragdicoccus niigatensis]